MRHSAYIVFTSNNYYENYVLHYRRIYLETTTLRGGIAYLFYMRWFLWSFVAKMSIFAQLQSVSRNETHGDHLSIHTIIVHMILRIFFKWLYLPNMWNQILREKYIDIS